MTLSDSDRAAIQALMDSWFGTANRIAPTRAEERIFLAGKAAARLQAIEEVAKACEQKWRDGYRGDVVVGFAHFIRSIATKTGDAT